MAAACATSSSKPSSAATHGWTSKGYYGLDQGPIVMMIENHLTGWFWELTKGCESVSAGLRWAGFDGGIWLDT